MWVVRYAHRFSLMVITPLAMWACLSEPTTPLDRGENSPPKTPVDPIDAARIELRFARVPSAPLKEFDTITVSAAILDVAGKTIESASISWNLRITPNPGLDIAEIDPLSIVPSGVRSALLTVGNKEAVLEALSVYQDTRLRGTLELPRDTRLPTRGFVWSRQDGYVALPPPPGAIRVLPKAINNRGEVVGSVELPGSRRRFAFHWSSESGLSYPGGAAWVLESEASSINDAGLVTGWQRHSGVSQAFVWNRESGMSILPLAGGLAIGKAINASGCVAGDSENRGFRWSADSGISVVPSHPVYSHSSVVAMNDSGHVVGYYGNVDAFAPFLYEEIAVLWMATGEKIEISSCSMFCMTVLGLNNQSEVVGSTNARAFMWSRSKGMTWLDVGGGIYDVAVAINDGGDIAGFSRTVNSGVERAWLRRRNGDVDVLPLPEGARTMRVTGINSNGDVIGFSR